MSGEVKYMNIKIDYPKIKNKVNRFIRFERIMLIIFAISIVTCVTVNLCVGGKKWMLYVIGGEIIFYYVFLNKPLIDNTFIKKITITTLLICGYLYLIDFINDTDWSYLVIGIILFSIIIIQLFMFFIEFNYQKKKFIPLFLTSIGGIIYLTLAIIGVVEINWAIIVFGSLGVVSLFILLFAYHKIVIRDLIKYFSIK